MGSEPYSDHTDRTHYGRIYTEYEKEYIPMHGREQGASAEGCAPVIRWTSDWILRSCHSVLPVAQSVFAFSLEISETSLTSLTELDWGRPNATKCNQMQSTETSETKCTHPLSCLVGWY